MPPNAAPPAAATAPIDQESVALAAAVADVSVHPSAIVDAGASIGPGTRIWHWTHVCAGAVIGERCSLGQNVFVAASARLGNNVRVQNNVSIYDGVELADDVFCGPSMVFTNVINPRSHVSRKHAFRATRVGQGASIGANATVVCGVTIGAFAMVGAGAVVSRDVPDHALVTGVPARRRGWVCWCGVQLRGRGVVACIDCGRRYRITDDDCTAWSPTSQAGGPPATADAGHTESK